MTKKILITGGAGFIGGALADRLSQNTDNQIYIADNFKRGQKDDFLQKLLERTNVKLITLDLTEKADLNLIPSNIDEVYHLAAIVGVKHCLTRPAEVLRVNLLSTMNIIEFVKKNKIKKLLFSSTCENYAGGFNHGVIPIPTPEEIPLMVADVKNPRWSYAGSKIAGEQMVIFNAPENYDYRIVRYHNVFGPRMGFVHVIPEVLKRLHQEENPFKIFGKNQTRAFCFIEDAVTQTIIAMEKDTLKNEIVHIGNDSQEITIGELINKIFKITNNSPLTEEEKEHNASVNRRCPNINKMRTLGKYGPQYSLDEALGKTVSWYQKEINENRIWE